VATKTADVRHMNSFLHCMNSTESSCTSICTRVTHNNYSNENRYAENSI